MRIVDVLIAATLAKPETDTLTKIAQACRELPGGKTFHPSRLSEYLAGKDPTPEHLACLACVIGGDPRSLMDEISETDLQEALTAVARIRAAQEQHRQHAAAGQVSESAPSPAEIYGSLTAIARPVVVPNFPAIPADAMDVTEVPLYRDLRPAASTGSRLIFDTSQLEIEEWIPIPATVLRPGGTWFCARVAGDSMVGARLLDNDIVVCRFEPEPKSGAIVVVTVADETVVKLYEKRVGQPSALVSEPGEGADPIKDIECVPDQTFIHGVVLYRVEGVKSGRARKKPRK